MSTHGDANGAEHPIEVVLVTGMSGAGRTTVANVLRTSTGTSSTTFPRR